MYHRSEIVATEPLSRFNAASDTRFILFTRSNPTEGQVIPLGDFEAIRNSNFNPSHETRFTIHGWNGDTTSGVNLDVTREYLNNDDYNVFVVDWSKGAGTINYIDARNRVKEVAAVVGEFVDDLVHENGLSIKKLTIVGHSLGGHCAGMSARFISAGHVHAAILLDPAGPLFYYDSPEDRAHYDDADYVEVIHTNRGTLGFTDPIGDADFYPNGGSSQPGCGLDLIGTCAHGRSHDFFSESITSPDGFHAYECGSFDEIKNNKCQQLDGRATMGGDPVNHGLRGVFHLTTGSSAPFALGNQS